MAALAAGLLRASAAMLLLGLATVLGFLLADRSLEALAPAWLGILQGLFAGLLLHVVAHRTHTADADRRSRIAASLGGLAGLGLLALLIRDAGHSHDGDPLSRVLLAATELGRASAPALLLGLLLLALLAAWAPAPRSLLRTSPAGPLLQAVRGLALGLLRPAHARPVLPELRAQQAQGTPASASLAYLIAAPTLGIDALLLSLPLLGGGMTLARGLGAVVLALQSSAKWSAARPSAAAEPRSTNMYLHPGVVGSRFRSALAAMNAALPWLALGLLLAATLAPWLSPGATTTNSLVSPTTIVSPTIPTWLQIPLITAIGLPAHLCAAGVTPVIAVLLAAGLTPERPSRFSSRGPPSASPPSACSPIHGPRIARLNLVLVFVIAVGLGLALDLALALAPRATLFVPALLVYSDPMCTAMAATPTQGDLAGDLALIVLLALMLVSLLRQTRSSSCAGSGSANRMSKPTTPTIITVIRQRRAAGTLRARTFLRAAPIPHDIELGCAVFIISRFLPFYYRCCFSWSVRARPRIGQDLLHQERAAQLKHGRRRGPR